MTMHKLIDVVIARKEPKANDEAIPFFQQVI